MANDNTTTTKFKVDISELKAGITEANRQIKLANAQFKAASAGMDDWSKSTDGLQAKIKQTDTVLNSQKAVLTAYEKQLELIVGQYGENSAEADNMRIKIANQQAAVAKTEKSLGEYKTALVNLETGQKKSAGAYDTLKAKINEQEQELSELKNQYKNVATEQGTTSAEAQELATKINSLSTELGENKQKLSEADKSAESLDKSFEDTGKSADDTQKGGISALNVALGNLVANGITAALNGLKNLALEAGKAWSAFDDGTDTIIKATGATGEEANGLIDSYKNVSKTVVADSSEIGSAIGEVNTRFGLTGKELESLSTKFLKYSKLNNTDVATSVDSVQKALTAFGLSAGDAGGLLDTLNAVGQKTGANVETLATGLVQNATAFQELGLNASQSAMLMGQMETSGVDASAVMAGLKKALKEASKQGVPLDEMLSSLQTEIQGNSDATQGLQKSYEVFGRSGDVMFKALKDGALDFSNLSNEVSDFGGNVETTFANTLDAPDEFQLAIQNLKTEFGEATNELMQKYAPQIKSFLNDLTAKVLPAVTKGIGKIIDNLPEIEAGVAGIATAFVAFKAVSIIMGIVKAVKGWMIATQGMTAAQALLNTVMAANPIGLIIAAIAGLVVAFVTLWKKSEAFRNFWIGLWEGIKTTVGTVIEGIKGFFTGVIDWIKNNWQSILLILINPFAGLFNLLYQKCEGFRNFINGLWEGIKGLFSAIGQWFTDNVVTPVSTALTPLFTFITQSVNNILGLIRGTWALIQAVLGLVFEWVKKNVILPVKKAFSSLFNSIKNLASSAWTGIKAIFTGVKTWFTDNVVTPVKTAFSGIWSNLKTGALNAWNGVKEVFGGIATWFKDKFSAAWTAVKNVFSTGGKVFEGVKDGIVEAFKSVVNAIIRGINKVISIPFKAINKILKKIKKVKIAGIQPFKDMIDELSIPQIPELESGGVLKKGQVGLLEGNGAEAVVPLDKNKLWISKTAKELKNSLAKDGMTTGGQNVTNYTFNQTNNSPKALSRLEIYRQTKNQLAFIKGV